MRPSFEWGIHCEFVVQSYKKAVVSVPALSSGDSLNEKELVSRGEAVNEGKATLTEHLRFLESGQAIPKKTPLLILGIRNNLVNLRAPIIWKGHAYAVEGERPRDSLRPYYGIGIRDGKLSIGQALGGSSENWPDFFIAAE